MRPERWFRSRFRAICWWLQLLFQLAVVCILLSRRERTGCGYAWRWLLRLYVIVMVITISNCCVLKIVNINITMSTAHKVEAATSKFNRNEIEWNWRERRKKANWISRKSVFPCYYHLKQAFKRIRQLNPVFHWNHQQTNDRQIDWKISNARVDAPPA